MKNNSNQYNLVAENPQSTVVAEYYKLADRVRDGVSYQRVRKMGSTLFFNIFTKNQKIN